MKVPRKVDIMLISKMVGTTSDHATPERSVRNAAITMGTKALATPKRIAPAVLVSNRSSSEIGIDNSAT